MEDKNVAHSMTVTLCIRVNVTESNRDIELNIDTDWSHTHPSLVVNS